MDAWGRGGGGGEAEVCRKNTGESLSTPFFFKPPVGCTSEMYLILVVELGNVASYYRRHICLPQPKRSLNSVIN